MPAYNPGAGNDAVSIKFGGQESRIFTSYTVRKSILTQPSQFTVRLGHGEMTQAASARAAGSSTRPSSAESFTDQRRGETVNEILKKIPPETPFELYINNTLQQTGTTDGYRANGFATEVEIFGRDNLKFIHDPYLTADIAFANDTYTSLTEKVIKLLSINQRLSTSDEANLKLTTGVGIQDYVNPVTVDEIEPFTDSVAGTPGNKQVKRSITAKLGETYMAFLQRQYRRAGIFLWAAGDGSYVLSEPAFDQSPTYRLFRKRGTVRNAVNITAHDFKHDTTRRYTIAAVYGRGGRGKFGRAKVAGAFVDEYMVNLLGNQDKRPITFRDVNVTTTQQAEFYARRKLAELNRSAYHLQYTVPGHVAPNIRTGLDSTWAPNTVVEVQDDELGFHRTFYLEEVVFSRPPTQTTLTLIPEEFMIFASDEGD
jgi:prophage tail gpP-like protein